MQTTLEPVGSWKALARDFPILHQKVHGHPLIYFDNAATTQKPQQVVEVLRNYYEHDNANVHRGIHELSNRATHGFEAARTRAAAFINARSAEEIVVAPREPLPRLQYRNDPASETLHPSTAPMAPLVQVVAVPVAAPAKMSIVDPEGEYPRPRLRLKAGVPRV